jgi:ATP synthase protein I
MQPSVSDDPRPSRHDQTARPAGPQGSDPHEELASVVGEKEARKAKARREADKSVWFGLGMFGMIGWSVAVPALACVALGVWIDRTWPSQYSWTLMLLFVGVALGCANAWYWVTRERSKLP